jgi:hypothetical protein
MKLTEENKRKIDSFSYAQLLGHWRFAKIGDSWFEGETLAYWMDRMKALRKQPNGEALHVETSKTLGWDEKNWEGLPIG